MRTKLYLLTAIVIAAALLTACSSLPTIIPAKAAPKLQAADTTAAARTMTAAGTGKIYLIPDVAYVNIGVHTEAEDVKEALASNTSQAQKVASVLGEMGVDPKDIQTSAFNVFPQQQYDPQGQLIGNKYVVDNTIYVTVRDLNKLGEMLDGVVRSGANNINGITFDVFSKEQAVSDARRLAIEDARKVAQEMAQAAGIELGPVQNLSVYSQSGPIAVYDSKGGGAAASANPVPVSAGQLVIQMDASITFEIK
jgi:uncharacterized protein YggE